MGPVLDHPQIAKAEGSERHYAYAGIAHCGQVGPLQSACAECIVQQEHRDPRQRALDEDLAQVIGHSPGLGIVHLYGDRFRGGTQVRPKPLVGAVTVESELNFVSRQDHPACEKGNSRCKIRLAHSYRYAIHAHSPNSTDSSAAGDKQNSDGGGDENEGHQAPLGDVTEHRSSSSRFRLAGTPVWQDRTPRLSPSRSRQSCRSRDEQRDHRDSLRPHGARDRAVQGSNRTRGCRR